MEWVLNIFENLNGDSSFLTLSATSIASLPLSNDPPPGDEEAQHGPGHLPNPQVQERVLFDGNLNDILGGTLRDAMEQGKILERGDRVELDIEIDNQGQEGLDKAQDMVIYHNFV